MIIYLNLVSNYNNDIEITAHRGASALYPENTMSAFKGAYELGADCIELDAQQTEDGVLIILHDTNLERTTGVSKNTWEVSYEEIQKLDAGNFFDKKFKGEKIPTLEEVIKFAGDNKIKLNIELKPTEYEKNFEKDVVNLIKKYHLEDYCSISSTSYETLKQIKKYSKNIITIYILGFYYGDISKFVDVDCFSIEHSIITKTLVERIHKIGKKVYAWTVNNREDIKEMINLKVDNIITDDIELAKVEMKKSL